MNVKQRYSKSLVRDLYRMMVKIRLTEESFVEPIESREILCPVHLYSGQEAIAAGVCYHLRDGDRIFGSHRSHGHYLAKGGDLREMVAEIYCRESGCARGRGGSMHLVAPELGVLGVAPIVGGTVSLALGSALSSYTLRDKNVTVTFFGDGAVGEGVVSESLNFASLLKLPIIFVCENNLYSTHLPIRECRKADVPIARFGVPYGIRSMRVDGNDVLKMYDAAKEAVEFCRKGRGPVFMECLTYRMRGHVGPNDNIQGSKTDIRPKSEVDLWRKKDPLRRLETYAKRHGVPARELRVIETEIQEEVSAAHEYAKMSSFPAPEEVTRYVFR